VEQPTVVHAESCPVFGDDRRGTVLDTPFNRAFVHALKGRWSYGQRYWVPEEEIWWIEAGDEDEVEELVIEHFGGAVVVHEDGSETLRDCTGDYEQGGLF